MIRAFIACLFVTVFLSGSAQAVDYKYFLKVSTASLNVYKTATTRSKVIAKITKGESLQVAGKNKNFIKVKVPLMQNGFQYGWVKSSTTDFKVFRRTILQSQGNTPVAKKDPSPVKKKTSDKKSKQTSGLDQAFRESGSVAFRFFGGPVYSIKSYFSSSSLTTIQTRFGLGIDYIMREKLWLSMPFMYTQGQGFKTMGSGLDAYFSPFEMGNALLYGKLGLGYEYLFSGDNNMHGANINAGIGVDYVINDSFAVGFEPLSIQAMVYRTASTVPLNVRGQVLLTVRAKW